VHVLVQNHGNIVGVARVVEGVRRLDGEEIRIPDTAVVEADRDEDKKDRDASQCVGNGVEGRDER
jgi:hypothetical protein